jgi:hypothetical protein
MKRNPILSNSDCNKILNGRKEDRDGSKWDEKIHEPTGLTYVDLRYAVGDYVVKGGKSLGETAKAYKVCKSFVQKWAGVFRARQTLNKRAGRYAVGKNVFKSISNRPKNTASPVRDEIRKQVADLRLKFPFFGSAKIKAFLKLDAACATIDKILREEGLAKVPKKRHMNKKYGRFERAVSMDLVQIDYKEWAPDIHSIWILDDRSRFILGWRVDERTSADNVIELLKRTFEFWNINPRQILSDHGTEFYSVRGGEGRSALDKWCRENGIEHIHGRVRHPQTQGKIERSHGSAVTETPYFGGIDSLSEARKTMADWIEFYNADRPHQALGYACPAEAFLSQLIDWKAFAER